jgi:hypothetical protein
MVNPIALINKKVDIPVWSIKVFKSNNTLKVKPKDPILGKPTIQASDVTDVKAQFVADPFLITHDSKFYMFFEVLNKQNELGEIGLATSENGEEWSYDRIVLREKWHLSYPYVFKDKDQIYMVPESVAANGVFLYKAKNFPYEWEKVTQLVNGKYVDSTIFKYKGKWWMFSASNGDTLHLFFSNQIEEGWVEHPKSPIISGNINISRPAGRVVIKSEGLYRFAQDGFPAYGTLVKSIKINKLSETEYEEEEDNIILTGSGKSSDWRKSGMHQIDQIQIKDNEWMIALDGHIFIPRNYLFWQFERLLRNPRKSLFRVFKKVF